VHPNFPYPAFWMHSAGAGRAALHDQCIQTSLIWAFGCTLQLLPGLFFTISASKLLLYGILDALSSYCPGCSSQSVHPNSPYPAFWMHSPATARTALGQVLFVV